MPVRRRSLAAVCLAGGVFLLACGQGTTTARTSPPSGPSSTTAAEPLGAPVGAHVTSGPVTLLPPAYPAAPTSDRLVPLPSVG